MTAESGISTRCPVGRDASSTRKTFEGKGSMQSIPARSGLHPSGRSRGSRGGVEEEVQALRASVTMRELKNLAARELQDRFMIVSPSEEGLALRTADYR